MRVTPLTSGRLPARMLAVVSIVAVAALTGAGVAAARPEQQGDTTTTTLPLPDLVGGVTVTGATVQTPGAPERKLDAEQATAFMQYWLPASIFQQVPNVLPPPGVPRSTLDVTTRWHDQDYPMKVYFAQQGKNAWVGMPAQDFGWALVDKERWIEAQQPEKLIAAFQGKEKAVRGDPGPAPTTTTIAGKAAGSSSDSDSGSALPWVLGGIGLVVVAGLVIFLVVRRRSGASTPS